MLCEKYFMGSFMVSPRLRAGHWPFDSIPDYQAVRSSVSSSFVCDWL